MNIGSLTLKECRYGWMLYCGPTIGACFDLYGEYSECEVQAMRGFIRPGDVVIDIGANIGDLTLPLAQMVGPEGRVYAIESHSHNYNVLCGNLALNGVSNVRPINAFVRQSEHAIIQRQFVADDYTTLAIDDLGLKRCRLIKIDVDGNELDVLLSADDTIRRLRPVLYLENDIREKSQALLEHLFRMDYNLYWHIAPVFQAENFAANPVNHWAPDQVVSLMVLAVPPELGINIVGLAPIRNAEEWGLPG